MIEIVTDPGWNEYAEVVHGFSTRRGGVSSPPFDQFNWSLNVGDHRPDVEENRRRFSRQLRIPLSHCVTVRQVHGDDCWVIDRESPLSEIDGEKGYDILITDRRGILLGIQTADCLPLLMYDPKRSVVAAIHAGWRGTYLGVVGKAVHQMEVRFGSDPRDMVALLGPSIGSCCYEFGADPIEDFKRRYPEHTDSIVIRDRCFFFDLKRANRLQLIDAGLHPDRIASIAICTSCQNDRFFSVRRSKTTGRQLNYILLRR